MDWTPGTKLGGRYVLGRLLGRGGTASVYRALDERLGVPVAVKVLTVPEGSNQRRLSQEALLQAGLRHPNIVAVTDLVEAEGRWVVVMELVDGLPLDAVLEGGRLTLEEALALFRGILEGVGAAHEAGLVHRDLKPANVMVTRAGDRLIAKVADFGLAKVVLSPSGQTRTGALLGTPRYMSPEQIRDSKEVDARSDLWALGAVLQEMLSGKPAFDHPDLLTLLNRIASGQREPLLTHLPPSLEQALDRCLVVDREARVASVADLKALLGPPSVERFRPDLLDRIRPAPREEPKPRTPGGPTPSETWDEQAPPSLPDAPPRQGVPWRHLAGGAGALLVVFSVILAATLAPQDPGHFTVAEPPPLRAGVSTVALYEQAWREFLDNDVHRSRRHVDDVLRTAPGEPAPWLMAGALALSGRDALLADQLFEEGEALGGQGAVPNLLQVLRRAEVDRDGLREAEEGLRRHLTRWPDDRMARSLLGMGMVWREIPYDEGLLAGLAREQPVYAGGWVLWVAALRGQRQLDQAREVAREGLGHAPQSAPLWAELAVAELMAGDPPAALAAAEQALKIDPAWWPARLHGANAAINLGRSEQFERLVAPMRGEEVPARDRLRFSAWIGRALGNVGQLHQSAEWAELATSAAQAADAPETLLQVWTYQVEIALSRWMAEDHELARRLARLDQVIADPASALVARDAASRMSRLGHGVLAARRGEEAEATRAASRLEPAEVAQVQAELDVALGRWDALEGRPPGGCGALVVVATGALDTGRRDLALAFASRVSQDCARDSALPFGLIAWVETFAGVAGADPAKNWPHPDPDLPLFRRTEERVPGEP